MGLFNIFKKKEKVNLLAIPPEVLNEFEEAERQMIESGGQKKPYQILFDIAQAKRLERTERRNEENGNKTTNTRTSQSIGNTKYISQRSPGVPERRNIQTPVAPVDRKEYAGNQQPNPRSRKLIFRRRGTTRVSDY